MGHEGEAVVPLKVQFYNENECYYIIKKECIGLMMVLFSCHCIYPFQKRI